MVTWTGPVGRLSEWRTSLDISWRESASSWPVSSLRKSPGSGRSLLPDRAEKLKGEGLTPGSRVGDLLNCGEKLEGPRLGMTNSSRSKLFLENTTNRLNAITDMKDSRQMRHTNSKCHVRFEHALCIYVRSKKFLSSKRVRQIKIAYRWRACANATHTQGAELEKMAYRRYRENCVIADYSRTKAF